MHSPNLPRPLFPQFFTVMHPAPPWPIFPLDSRPLSLPAVKKSSMVTQIFSFSPAYQRAFYTGESGPRCRGRVPRRPERALRRASLKRLKSFNIFLHISRYSPIEFFKLPLPGQPACCMLGTISVPSSLNIYQRDLRVALGPRSGLPTRRTA
jgi:hypothetical protein